MGLSVSFEPPVVWSMCGTPLMPSLGVSKKLHGFGKSVVSALNEASALLTCRYRSNAKKIGSVRGIF